jgi:ABC-type multidrug transport system fused ATPase/permease subunit
MHRSVSLRDESGKSNNRLRNLRRKQRAREMRNVATAIELQRSIDNLTNEEKAIRNRLEKNLKNYYNRNLTPANIKKVLADIQLLNNNRVALRTGLAAWRGLMRDTPNMLPTTGMWPRIVPWIQAYENTRVNNINWNSFIKNSVRSIRK